MREAKAGSRKLTLRQLRGRDACQGQIDLFSDFFGKSVLVTEQLCRDYAVHFSWGWAARKLISPTGHEAFSEGMSRYYLPRADQAALWARLYISEEPIPWWRRFWRRLRL